MKREFALFSHSAKIFLMHKAKILATLGPACDKRETIEAMLR